MSDTKRRASRETEQNPGHRFGYEMAFDPRFEGRRWADVASDLRAVFPVWAEHHGYDNTAAIPAWDEVKGAVREAWEGALAVEHREGDPRSGQWQELAMEYRRHWEAGPDASRGRWEDVEPGYRYGYEMRWDPRFQGRLFTDVESDLSLGLPGWAASNGYHVGEGESLWIKLRRAIQDGWERATHGSSRSEASGDPDPSPRDSHIRE